MLGENAEASEKFHKRISDCFVSNLSFGCWVKMHKPVKNKGLDLN